MSKLDVLAVGAHPDDVELGCGATLALAARQGRRVGILHLTRGERGTRGTAEERLAEAERAAAALGAVELAFLDCGDGSLRTGEAEEDSLIEVLRTWRPDIVLGPPSRDRHPDHGRGHSLVAAACFYAGLRARGTRAMGEPHRPGALFSYMQHYQFEPSFIVDVSAVWEAKVEALAAYRSQIYQAPPPDGPPSSSTPGDDGTPTKVSSKEFRLAVEGRGRHYGQLIGVEMGEPFYSEVPLAVGDLMAVLPGGMR